MLTNATCIDISTRAKVAGLSSDKVLDLCGTLGIRRPAKVCDLAEKDGARLSAELGRLAAQGRAARNVELVHSRAASARF